MLSTLSAAAALVPWPLVAQLTVAVLTAVVGVLV